VTGKKAATTAKRSKVAVARAPAARPSRPASRSRTDPSAGVITPVAKLEGLVAAFGNNRVAELLDVSRSQPSRWRSRREGISVENERRVVDLEYVLSRLLRVYPRRVAETWLVSHNAHLGARPIDVLRLNGPVPVIEAVDAAEHGAYA